MANDRLMNAAQGDSIITALQTIAQKSESPYHSGNKLNPAYIDTGALANGMTATTQSTDDDSTKLATTAFVHDVVDTLPTPMVYRGTLGTGGTITTLPVDGSADIGDVYKVITAGTYTSQEAKIGDIFICHTKTSDSNTWDYIPTGDDVDVTEVSAGIGLTTQSGSAITTTGTIKAKLQNETKLGADASTVSNPGSLTTNIQPVLTDNSGNLAVKVDKSDVGLGNVTNDAQVKKISSSTSGNIVTWGGTDGATVSDSGKAIATTFANNANQIPTGAAITSGVTGTATMTGYTIDPSSSPAAITTSNTINEAIGKLEKTTSINKNNILLTADQSIQYNYMDFNNYGIGNSGTINSINTTTNTITVSGTAPWAKGIIYLNNAPAGTYILKYTVSSNSSASAAVTMNEGSTQKTSKVWNNSTGDYTSGVITFGNNAKSLYVTANNSTSALTNSVTITITNVMLIPTSVYNAGFTNYQPYALPNAELTVKEQTNEDNILSIYNTGFAQKNVMHIVLDEVKALLPSQPFVGNTTTFGNLSVTFNEDNSITLNGSHTAAVAINFKDLSHINMPTNAVGAASANITLSNDIFFGLWGNSGVSNLVLNDGVDIPSDYASKYSRGFVIRVSANTVCNNVRIYPMVCDKALYQASSEVVPYALPNTTITPALKECVDNGAKNRLPATSTTTSAGNGLTLVVNSDYSITITGTMTTVENTDIYFLGSWTNTSPYANYTGKNMRMYCKSSASIVGQFKMYDRTANKGYVVAINNNEGANISGNLTAAYFTIAATANAINVTLYPMICEPSLYIVSQQYVPPAMSNAELANIAVSSSGKTVFKEQYSTSKTVTYTMKITDFSNVAACGVYMIYIVSWGTSPALSVYAAYYSGGVATYSAVTKIAGTDAAVSVSGDTISVTSSGKIQIIAM